MVYEGICWDWKEDVDWKQINKVLRRFGFSGCIREVNTESDMICIIISGKPITQKYAQKQFEDDINEL